MTMPGGMMDSSVERDALPWQLPWRVSLAVLWGVVCGFLATGPFRWRGDIALRLLTIWVLADPLLDYLFSSWQAVARFRLPVVDTSAEAATAPVTVPYAEPDSPGWRLALLLNHWLRNWRRAFWPNVLRPVLLSIALGAAGLVIGQYLGQQALITLVAALTAGLILAVGARQARVWPTAAAKGIQVMAAWAMAAWVTVGVHIGERRLISLFVGGLVACTLTCQQVLTVRAGRSAAEGLLRIGWWGLALLLMAARQPLLGAGMAVVAVWQALRCGRRRGWADFLIWMFASGLAALASRYWS